MIRKTLLAATVAGALALGTASATSLGTFSDVTFAASDVDLLDCQLHENAIALIPEIPEIPELGTVLEADFLDSITPRLGSIQVDLSQLLDECIDDETFTLLVSSLEDVVASIELTDLAGTLPTGVTLDGSDLTIGSEALTLLDGLTVLPDVSSITHVRMVLSDTAPAPAI